LGADFPFNAVSADGFMALSEAIMPRTSYKTAQLIPISRSLIRCMWSSEFRFIAWWRKCINDGSASRTWSSGSTSHFDNYLDIYL